MPTLKKGQPAIAEKRGLNAGNGGPTRWDRLFLTPFIPKRTQMVLPVPSKSLLGTSPDAVMLLHPSGIPTHLPLSCPFCWSRAYLQRMLPEVTSWSWES